MTKHKLILTLLLTLEIGLVSSCSLLQDEPEDSPEAGWGLEKTSDSYIPAIPSETPTLDFVSCGADLDWATPNDNYWLDPGFFGFSPNDGLLLKHDRMNGMSAAFSTHDGSLLSPDSEMISGLTASGLIGVVASGPSLRIISTITGEDIARMESTPDSFQAAAITNDGAKVAAITCADTAIAVNLYEGTTLRQMGSLSLSAAPCYQWHATRWHLQFTPNGDELLFSVDDEIHALDLATGEDRVLIAHSETTLEEFENQDFDTDQRVLELKLSPDGTLIASAGTDGTLKVHQLNTFELVSEYSTTPHRMNLMTYAPSITMAPLAWAPDSQTLAFLQDDLILVTDGTRELSLEMPELDSWDSDYPRNVPALMEFSHDGRQLAVAAEGGSAMFGCGVQRPQEPNTIQVLLEGPSEAKVQDRLTLTATHVGQLELHAHQFRVNGVPLTYSTSERELQWTPTEAGVHEIEVEISNGIKTGTAAIQVVVSE